MWEIIRKRYLGSGREIRGIRGVSTTGGSWNGVVCAHECINMHKIKRSFSDKIGAKGTPVSLGTTSWLRCWVLVRGEELNLQKGIMDVLWWSRAAWDLGRAINFWMSPLGNIPHNAKEFIVLKSDAYPRIHTGVIKVERGMSGARHHSYKVQKRELGLGLLADVHWVSHSAMLYWGKEWSHSTIPPWMSNIICEPALVFGSVRAIDLSQARNQF